MNIQFLMLDKKKSRLPFFLCKIPEHARCLTNHLCSTCAANQPLKLTNTKCFTFILFTEMLSHTTQLKIDFKCMCVPVYMRVCVPVYMCVCVPVYVCVCVRLSVCRCVCVVCSYCRCILTFIISQRSFHATAFPKCGTKK